MFTEIEPCEELKLYIKTFYFYESTSSLPFNDIVFPSGNMELIFNLGEGQWKVRKKDGYVTTPFVEFWGQITKPLPIQSVGRNVMLGVRFFPHSAACFYRGDLLEINNEIVDGSDILNRTAKELRLKLLQIHSLESRIKLVEDYLLSILNASNRKVSKVKLVGEIAASLKSKWSDEKVSRIAQHHNISVRYLNKLFLEYTGLTPKFFSKISRFQHSLNLLHQTDEHFTSVGYDAGYFDQSHFIRDFKSFTGITPTSFSSQTLPINNILVTSIQS